MPQIRKSVLLPYSAERMYALVSKVRDYPLFMPWCGGAREAKAGDGRTRATVDIDYHGVKSSFTTLNRNSPSESIALQFADGPFSTLDGAWRFHQFGGGCLQGRIRAQLRICRRRTGQTGGAGVRWHRQFLHRRFFQACRGALWLTDFAVTVVYAYPGGAREIRVWAALGATLAEAVRASGILERCPEIDPGTAKIGVWGKLRDPASVARADDRIEIYRPLVADPKTTRSARADKKRRLAGNSGRK